MNPRYVRIRRFAELTGYTEKAVYSKIEAGVFTEPKHYRRGPDGNILMDMEGFEKWVESERGAWTRGKHASDSGSTGSESGARKN